MKHSYCCENSLNLSEGQFGTATRVDVWLALEYRGSWSSKAFEGSKMPERVKDFIRTTIDAIPNSRLQLIKRHDNTQKNLKFYVAVSEEISPRLYELELSTLDELLGLDVKEILKGQNFLTEEELFLVCTNGKRDVCCGKFGVPIYLEVAQGKYGSSTWQSTHLGGHRFAPTFVCLPHGIYYGRVKDPLTAERLMEKYGKGQVDLKNYRGRCCYEKGVQVAEYFCRKESGINEISKILLQSSQMRGDESTVRFISHQSDGIEREVKIRENENSLEMLKNCGDEETFFVSQYSLVHYREKERF